MKKYCPPAGNPQRATIALIGEQPGVAEVNAAQRRPFIGRAGRIFRSYIREFILENQVYFSNVIKDLDNPIGYYINAKTHEWTEAGEEYLSALAGELGILKTPYVGAVGNVALKALTGRWGVTKWRGSLLDCSLIPGKKVIPMIHPSTVLRGQFLNSYLIKHDLQKLIKFARGRKPTKIAGCLIIPPTYNEAIRFLKYCQKSGREGAVIGYDIETDGILSHDIQMSCISFSVEEDAICIPFIYSEKGIGRINYFLEEEEVKIMKFIQEILEDEGIQKVGQNLIFDGHFLFKRYGIIQKSIHDTMVLSNTVMGDFPKGLDFIASIYTDIPYYKDDGKVFLSGNTPDQRGWEYNALDSIVCTLALPALLGKCKKQGNLKTYERQMATIEPLMYMMERGVRVDMLRFREMQADLESRERDCRTELYTLMKIPSNLSVRVKRIKRKLAQCKRRKRRKDSQEENTQSYLTRCIVHLDALLERLSKYNEKAPNSGPQLKKWFAELKAPLYKSKTGGDSFDKLALQRYIRWGQTHNRPKVTDSARLIQKIRKTGKLLSTYFDLKKIDKDDRLRCSYNPVGTRFSRFSSSANIFGTGMNMQNLPPEMKLCLIADEGYLLFEIDLSQAENRIVAFVANCKSMMDAFEQGKDVHSLTGSVIARAYGFSLTPEQIKAEDKAGKKAPIGNKDKTWRQWGKIANHALNYDLSYKGLALQMEIAESVAKTVMNAYHSGYPEVRQVFHNYIRTSLKNTRSVINLMGRRTVFLDRFQDSLYKEAYACLPQGTVGDVINERGLNFIYENQMEFKPIELLSQVHDSVVFQIPLKIGWPLIAGMILKIKESLEVPLTTHHGKEFIIPIDLMIGNSFNFKGEGQEIPYEAMSSKRSLAESLEEHYALL